MLSDRQLSELLYDAVAANDVPAVEKAIADGADVNYRKPVLHRSVQAIAGREWSPLHQSVFNNHVGITALLLHHRASVTLQDQRGNTPCHWGALLGHTACLRELLRHDPAAVHIANEGGATCLHAAVASSASSSTSTSSSSSHAIAAAAATTTNALSPSSSSSSSSTTSGASSTANASSSISTIGCLELLVLEAGAFINAQCSRGWTPLHHAAFADDQAIVCFLLEHRASVTLRDIDGDTALHKAAAAANHSTTIAPLIAFAADVDARSSAGETPLHVAIRRRHQAAAFDLIVRYNASITVVTERGLSPLHYAVASGLVGLVSFLIERGCNVNQSTYDGSTPLLLATALLGPDSPNDQGDGPKRGPMRIPHLNSIVCNTLESNGTKEHIACELFSSMHEIARAELAFEMARLLLAKGADPMISNSCYETPFHLAAFHGGTPILEALIAQKTTPAATRPTGMVRSRTIVHPASSYAAVASGSASASASAAAVGPPPPPAPSVVLSDPSTWELYSPLHSACSGGRLACTSILVEQGMSVNMPDNHGRTPIMYAIDSGHLEAVQWMIRKGADYRVVDRFGNTTLHFLSDRYNSGEICSYLLELMTNEERSRTVAAVNSAGDQPLHRAARFGNAELVALLLNSRAQVNRVGRRGRTPLHYAARHSHAPLITRLVSANAEINVRDGTGRTALHYAVMRDNEACIRALFGAFADALIGDSSGKIPLHYAAALGLPHTANLLLALFGVPQQLQATSSSRNTALHFASYHGSLTVVRTLLEKKASVNVENDDGCTALHFAVVRGNTRIAESLIQCLSLVNSLDARGISPLQRSLLAMHSECTELLLTHSANVNHCDSNLETPLHWAIGTGSRQSVGMLLSAGANMRAESKEHLTPLQQATKLGLVECMEQLLRRGVAVTQRSRETGESPLHTAARFGRSETLSILLPETSAVHCDEQRERYLEVRDRAGNTPMHIAAQYNNADFMRLLALRGADIQALNDRNETPMHLACDAGSHDAVQLLVELCAESSAVDENGLTPLLRASIHGHSSCIMAIVNDYYNDSLLVPSSPYHAGDSTNLDDKSLVNSNGSEDGVGGVLGFNPHTYLITEDRDQQGETAVFWAVRHKHLTLLRYLLEHGFEANPPNAIGETPLHVAARVSSVPMLEVLLSARADLNSSITDLGESVLHYAAAYARADTIQYLISRRVPIDAHTLDSMQTPLHYAARHGNLAAVETLIRIGAERGARTLFGDTPLHYCAQYNHPNLISHLLQSRATPDTANAQRDTPLHIAARYGSMAACKMLLVSGARIVRGNNGYYPLHYAAEYGDPSTPLLDFLQSTATSGTAVAASGGMSITSAMSNSAIMRKEASNPTTAHGAANTRMRSNTALSTHLTNQIDSIDNQQQTALHKAARLGHVEFCRALLNCSANPYLEDVHQQSTVDLGLASPIRACRELFVELADPSCVDLAHAMRWVRAIGAQRSLELLKSLYERLQQCPQYNDRCDETFVRELVALDPAFCASFLLSSRRLQPQCLHLVSKIGSAVVLQRLLDSPFRPDIESKRGIKKRTALHEAVMHSAIECVDMLLAAGASLDTPDADGNTAFSFAEFQQQQQQQQQQEQQLQLQRLSGEQQDLSTATSV